MEDFTAFIVVLVVIGVVFTASALLALVLLFLTALYGLMHVSAWVYTRVTGKSWI